jgi:hypothetical protein
MKKIAVCGLVLRVTSSITSTINMLPLYVNAGKSKNTKIDNISIN